jgi:hypothetical protein
VFIGIFCIIIVIVDIKAIVGLTCHAHKAIKEADREVSTKKFLRAVKWLTHWTGPQSPYWCWIIFASGVVNIFLQFLKVSKMSEVGVSSAWLVFYVLVLFVNSLNVIFLSLKKTSVTIATVITINATCSVWCKLRKRENTPC